MNKDVWDQKVEKFCPECQLKGTQQFLGEDSICPVHGLVAPAYGELEDHKPDVPGSQNNGNAYIVPGQPLVASFNMKNAKKKKKKDKDEVPPKIYQSDEIKMFSDPLVVKDKNDDNSYVEQSWAALAGDG